MTLPIGIYWKIVLLVKVKTRSLIEKRGKKAIKKMFHVPTNNSKRFKYQILGKIPKCYEFQRENLIDKLSTLLENALKYQNKKSECGRLIKYEELIEHFHAKPAHFNEEHSNMEECPDSCDQKMVCERIRDVQKLIDQILMKMSERFPIYKDVRSIIVGSVKERTKVGKIDEVDVILSFANKDQDEYKQMFEFDAESHQIKVKGSNPLQNRFKPFITDEEDEQVINATEYFITFLDQFHDIIDGGTLNLPSGLHLTTKFVPCEVCKNEDYETTVYNRCRHAPGCEEHRKIKSNPQYKETCQCANYSVPSMSWTKIGVALHLGKK